MFRKLSNGLSRAGVLAGTIGLALAVGAAPLPAPTGPAPRLTDQALLPGVPAAVAVPDPQDLAQQTAEPPITGPGTASCTVTLMQDKPFRNTAYPPANPAEPDRNFKGSYAPPAGCTGPWSKIVLTVSTRVDGVQFDRLLDVYVGGALLLSSSTSEPCCIGQPGFYVHWTAQRDVSQYAALLAQPQGVSIDLGNVVDATYTGIYVSTATLTFYRTGPTAPAVAAPDWVLGVHSAVDNLQQDGYYVVNRAGEVASQAVSFPRNLTALHAELFAQGHGACEEFWWGEPGQCGTGTPYREVAVYLDGKLAGAAPVFPVTFTGASGPGLWEPIPSPRAWNLRPYEVDLTPFVGTLTDGAIHTVGLAALEASYPQGDIWELATNLLGWTDPGSKQTSGALLSAQAPALPTDAAAWDASGQALYTDRSSHTLDFSGWVQGSRGRAITTVHQAMSASSTQPAGAVQTRWDWASSSVVTDAQRGTQLRAASAHETWGITSTPLTHFTIAETRQASSSEGTSFRWSSYSREMQTSDATGIAWQGASSDTYRYADSDGACVDHTLAAASGMVVADYNGSSCRQALP
jgi:hypothetical protein